MPPRARFTERLRITLPAHVREALDDLGERDGRRVSDLIREALNGHLQPGSPGYPPVWTSPRDAQMVVVMTPATRAGLDGLAELSGLTPAGEARVAIYHYLRRRGIETAEPQPSLLSA